MHSSLFYFFAALMLIGAAAVPVLRNPVASAMAMVASFIGLAALFIGLNAYFVGIIQILVYAGAIMVLFIFIIMLLDLKAQASLKVKPLPIIGGLFVVVLFAVQLVGVLDQTPNKAFAPLKLTEVAKTDDFKANHPPTSAIHRAVTAPEPSLPDVHLIGHAIFQGQRAETADGKVTYLGYNLPLQIIGVLLLVATIGVVALSRRQAN